MINIVNAIISIFVLLYKKYIILCIDVFYLFFIWVVNKYIFG